MLIPKRTKYRKQHRPVRTGMSLFISLSSFINLFLSLLLCCKLL